MTNTLVFMRQAFAHLSVSICVCVYVCADVRKGKLANTHKRSIRYFSLPTIESVSRGGFGVVVYRGRALRRKRQDSTYAKLNHRFSFSPTYGHFLEH